MHADTEAQEMLGAAERCAYSLAEALLDQAAQADGLGQDEEEDGVRPGL